MQYLVPGTVPGTRLPMLFVILVVLVCSGVLMCSSKKSIENYLAHGGLVAFAAKRQRGNETP